MGQPFSLDSVTAIALGGVQLAGGVGSVIGAVLGTVTLGLIANGIIQAWACRPSLRAALTGVLLLGAISSSTSPDNRRLRPVVAEPSRTLAGSLKSAGGRLLSLPISYIGTILLVVCAGLARPVLLQPFLLMLILRQAAPLGLAVIGLIPVHPGAFIGLVVRRRRDGGQLRPHQRLPQMA